MADSRGPAAFVTLPARAVGTRSSVMPFGALPTAPGLARGHVTAVLAGWGLEDISGTAEMVSGELVANAVQAPASVQADGEVLVIRLCLITEGDVLAIEVWDQAPGFPVIREADRFAESGRGLVIIDALTSGRWGCRTAIGRRGKCVWAVITRPDTPDRKPR